LYGIAAGAMSAGAKLELAAKRIGRIDDFKTST